MPAPAEIGPRYLDNSYIESARERGVEFERRPRQRVVILGSEMATPFGNEEETMAALYEGRSAIQYLPDGRNYYTNIGGLLPSPRYDAFDELDKSDPRFKKGGKLFDLYEHKRKHHRAGNFRMAATMIDIAISAAKKAGIWDENNGCIRQGIANPSRVSSTTASGYGEGQRIIDIYKYLFQNGVENVTSVSRRLDVRDVMASFPEEFNGQTEIALKAQGWGISSPEACATGGSSLAELARLIRDGYTDLGFGGGFEEVLREHKSITLAMFASGVRALPVGKELDPTKASRPWSATRDGFVPSSGGGGMWLASLDWVIENGLENHIQGEIIGFAKGSDASPKNPLMDPQRVADVTAQALFDEIIHKMYDADIVAAHATGTRQGDDLETQAYRMVFGDRLRYKRFTAIKSMLGHLLGGAGAVNAIVAKRMFTDNLIPQTINCEDPDPEIMKHGEIYIVRGKPEPAHDVDIVVATALGFGGKNAVLALRRWNKEYAQQHIANTPYLQKYLASKKAA